MSGLGKISGERIWMEMKKIFLLNMRGELIQTFLECGAAKYIGKNLIVDQHIGWTYIFIDVRKRFNIFDYPSTFIASTRHKWNVPFHKIKLTDILFAF